MVTHQAERKYSVVTDIHVEEINSNAFEIKTAGLPKGESAGPGEG